DAVLARDVAVVDHGESGKVETQRDAGDAAARDRGADRATREHAGETQVVRVARGPRRPVHALLARDARSHTRHPATTARPPGAAHAAGAGSHASVRNPIDARAGAGSCSLGSTPDIPGANGAQPPVEESRLMKKTSAEHMWEMMRLRHGIGLRCIDAIPADQLDARPVKDMRTPKELVVHMYSFLRDATESLASRTLTSTEEVELAATKTKQDLVKFADRSWKAASAAFEKLTDAQLTGTVKAPWGEMQASDMIGTVQDE